VPYPTSANPATVLVPDIMAGRAIVHVVHSVLVPRLLVGLLAHLALFLVYSSLASTLRQAQLTNENLACQPSPHSCPPTIFSPAVTGIRTMEVPQYHAFSAQRLAGSMHASLAMTLPRRGCVQISIACIPHVCSVVFVHCRQPQMRLSTRSGCVLDSFFTAVDTYVH